MLEYIRERQNCWEYLKQLEIPIFIYGMGDGALKILSVFKKYKIPCAGFFASDEFVRGHYFEGHLVHKLSEIEGQVDDFAIVLAFAAGYRSLYDKVRELSGRHILLAPDVPVVTDSTPAEDLFTYEYCLAHAGQLDRVYNLLADEQSKIVFSDVLNFKISGRIDYLHRCTTEREEVYKNLCPLRQDEVFVDLGAYTGDTAEEFISACGGEYKKIYAFEPNRRNFRKMLGNLQGQREIELFCGGAWDSTGKLSFTEGEGRMSRADLSGKNSSVDCYAVDDVMSGATIIKMDVEGAERRAILGAKKNIAAGASVFSALYHRNEDIFDIPLLLHEINPKLKFFIRHHLYIPAWETNLYAIQR